jgi:hypothetical protein
MVSSSSSIVSHPEKTSHPPPFPPGDDQTPPRNRVCRRCKLRTVSYPSPRCPLTLCDYLPFRGVGPGASPVANRKSESSADSTSDSSSDEGMKDVPRHTGSSPRSTSELRPSRLGGLWTRGPRSEGSEIVRSRMRGADFVLATREALGPTPRKGCAWDLLFQP